MTREEAIYILKAIQALICPNKESVLENNFSKAFDMAIEALSAEHKHCWDCKHYEPKYNVCHAPEVVKQVTSKLKKPCDSLLTEESNGSKEQKSKLEHDRDWIIGCIKHDGFIKTDRFDKANQIILDALSAEYEDYEHATLVDIKEPLKVEVVRCKDCRYWKNFNNAQGICHERPNIITTEQYNDFCSHGERREE